MNNPNFQILNHPADLKILARGKHLKQVFTNMALAMMQSIKKGTPSPTIKRQIKVESTDKESLLVDFLSEILYLVDTNNEVYPKIEITNFSKTSLSAKLKGAKVKGFDTEIKAVTYGAEKIRETEQGWEAVVIFDI